MTTSFGVDPSTVLIVECLIRVALSFVAGIVLGLERKFRQQVVGMRTLILISVSSCLLGMLSFYYPDVAGSGDSARIAAQVVSGIGFLGAGAILRQGLNIKGLTSAAIIWTTAAVGLSFGSGFYIPAFGVLVLSVFALIFFEKVEDKLFPAARTKNLRLTFNEESVDIHKIRDLIEKEGFIISDFNMSRIIDARLIILQYSVKSPKLDDFSNLVEALKGTAKLTEFSITD